MEPKTTRSRRAVELTNRGVDALADHRRHQTLQRLLTPGWRDSGLVFTNLKGGAMQPHQANVELTRALRSRPANVAYLIDELVSSWIPATREEIVGPILRPARPRVPPDSVPEYRV